MCDFEIMLLGLQNTLFLICCLLVLCTQGVYFMQAHIIKGTFVYVVEGNKGKMLMILLFFMSSKVTHQMNPPFLKHCQAFLFAQHMYSSSKGNRDQEDSRGLNNVTIGFTKCMFLYLFLQNNHVFYIMQKNQNVWFLLDYFAI